MLSQTSGYAILALGCVAEAQGAPVLVRHISGATNIPSAYLAKIINSLARKGIVNTQRGIGGGVTLARSAKEVSLYELCEALDDPIVQKRCMLGLAECSDERACPAHHFWNKQREVKIDFLKTMTVFDVAQFEAFQRGERKRRERSSA